jgi:putative MATE family efflux protein
LARDIWRNSWPILGIMGLNFLVGYTDVYVAGLLEPRVQAAIGFMIQQYFLFIILGNALSVGTVALVSQSVGAGRWDNVLDTTRQTLLLTVVLGAAVATLTYLGADWILRWFEFPSEVRPLAEDYLQIYAMAIPANYIVILVTAVLRAAGQPRSALGIMAVASFANIGCNFAFVFGWGPIPAMGYPGIGWSTVAGFSLGVLICIVILLPPPWVDVWRNGWGLSKIVVKEIARIAWPSALLQVGWNAGTLVLYRFIAQLGETSVTAMAAYANGLRLESLIFLPGFALNLAAGVLVGQSVGAGDYNKARHFGWAMAGGGALLLSSVAVVLYIFAPSVAALLSQDPAVLQETVLYIRVNMVAVPLMIGSIVLGGAMQGAGDTRSVMVIIIVAVWIVRLPTAWFLCFTMGLGSLGIWLSMPVSLTVQGILMIVRFASGKWYRARVEFKD